MHSRSIRDTFARLINEVHNCRLCESNLPYPPRPVLQIHPQAKILIAGQAPGIKVQQSGIPFDDASGDRLREWLAVSPDEFYDAKNFAILPMGFCYPGKGKSGDLPPRPECQPAWRNKLLAKLPQLSLTIVLGQYAQTFHYGVSKTTLTERVQNWQKHWPESIPLPHPSPRNNIWLKKIHGLNRNCFLL